jgi:DNA-binding NtrC family response regulator
VLDEALMSERLAGLDGEPQPLRILIVDDDDLLLELFVDALADQAIHIIGPARTLPAALHFATHESIDVGLLDVNVGGELVTPVADKLLERNVPFLFVTGYGALSDARFGKILTLKKPFMIDDLFGGIVALLPARLRERRLRVA